MIQYARSLVFFFLMYGLMALMGIIGIPFAAASRKATYWFIHTYCAMVLWMLRVICNLHSEIRGTVPTGAVIIASKHQSFLDIIMIVSATPRPKFIMKRELLYTPLIGFYGKRIGSAPVRRGDKSKAIKQMISGVEKDKDSPGQLVIYPQGTRIAPGAKREYKIGAGVLYERLGCDCIPAAVNVGVFWARTGIFRKPGTAVVEFLPAIPRGQPKEAFMKLLETTVESHSNRLMAEAGFEVPGSTAD